MSLSVSHVNVPEGFNFAMKMRPECCLLARIKKYYNPKRVLFISYRRTLTYDIHGLFTGTSKHRA